MPKVLRIINRFNLGGPTYNAAYLSKYLDPKYETLLIGGQKDESEGSSEYIVKNLGLEPIIIPEMRREISPKNDYIAYKKIKKIIAEFKPDIVHTHASKAGTLGRLAAFQSNVPVVVHTFHGHVFHSYFGKLKTTFYKNIERYLAKKSTRIIAISEKQKEELSAEHAICGAHKIDVIPLGFDLNRFTENQEEKRKSFRSLYNINDQEIAIAIVGRLVPVKNHRFFLDAVQNIAAKEKLPIRVFIVGDGELKEELIEYTKQLGLDYSLTPEKRATVHFTSWIKEVDVVYAGVDIAALTSFNEGTPVSLIEAQAASKPIVSTRVGGIENIVLENKTALLSDSGDLTTFVSNLKSLIINAESLTKFGEEGKQFALTKFSYQRLCSDVSTLYDKLLF